MLEPLLRASYGQGFSIADELDCFPNPAPTDWLWAQADEKAVGFLRHYEAGNNVSVAELYPLEAEVTRALLSHFKSHHRLAPDARLRFDFRADTLFLETVLSELCTITEIRTTYRYSKPIERGNLEPVDSVSEDDYPHIFKILGALKPFDLEQLHAFAERGALHVVRSGGVPVAAALTEQTGNQVLEIVALATDATERQCGHAKTLMQRLEQTANARAIEFDVVASNHAAIALYDSAGYRRLEDAVAYWCYTRWDAHD